MSAVSTAPNPHHATGRDDGPRTASATGPLSPAGSSHLQGETETRTSGPNLGPCACPQTGRPYAFTHAYDRKHAGSWESTWKFESCVVTSPCAPRFLVVCSNAWARPAFVNTWTAGDRMWRCIACPSAHCLSLLLISNGADVCIE